MQAGCGVVAMVYAGAAKPRLSLQLPPWPPLKANHCLLASLQVLYDFLLVRSRFQPAAVAMLGYARRLRAEGRGKDASVVAAVNSAYGKQHSMRRRLVGVSAH